MPIKIIISSYKSDSDRLSLVLSVLPDEKLVSTLEKERGHGRSDYPIRPMFNALIAGIIYQHSTAALLLRELKRNSHLRDICGFDPSLGGYAVPTANAFSNFLSMVIEHQHYVLEIFHELITKLQKELNNLGEKLAIDSKAIQSYGKPVKMLAYNLRTSVERVNSRIDQVLGFEKHSIRGQKKMVQLSDLRTFFLVFFFLFRSNLCCGFNFCEIFLLKNATN